MESEDYELDYETDDAGAMAEFVYPQESPPRQKNRSPARVQPSSVPLAAPEATQEATEGYGHSDTDNDEREGDVSHRGSDGTTGSPVQPGASSSPPPLWRRGVTRKRPAPQHKDGNVAVLTRKLTHYKKLNAELHNQLQKFYQNETVAFLENKAQDKQRQIDLLMQENKSLQIQQRALLKQVDELQESMDNLPAMRAAQKEELRICKEQLRTFKDKQKVADEKASKMHQQVVDLTIKNKSLVERIKQLESEALPTATSSSRSSILASQQETEDVVESQEGEITRLQHRVQVMKKAVKLDTTRHEKQIKMAHEELEIARENLEKFQNQVAEKEKTIRSQFLSIKQLKRTLKDASTHMQMNQQVHHATGGRDRRFANQHNHAQQLKYSSSHHGGGSGGRGGVHELLSRLGLAQLDRSPSKASSVGLGSTSSAATFTTARQQALLLSDDVVRHAPCPPMAPHVQEGHAPRMARIRKHNSRVGTNSEEVATPDPPYEDVDPSTFQSVPSTQRSVDPPGEEGDTYSCDGYD